MNITDILWSKKSQTQKEYILYDLIYMKFNTRSSYSVVMEVDIVVTFGRRRSIVQKYSVS